MVDSLPTGSVTGKDDWEWNRLQANRQSAAVSRQPQSSEPRVAKQPRPPRRSPTPDPSQRELQALLTELERTQRRLQAVIERYEALLAEKNRRLARAVEEGPSATPATRVIQAIRRLIASR